MKKLVLLFLVFCGLYTAVLAQGTALHTAQPHTADGWIQLKNYYLLSLLEQNKEAAKMLANDPVLSELTKTKVNGLQSAVNECKDLSCFVHSMELTDAEIKQVSNKLTQLYKPDNALGRLVSSQLIPSSAYSLYKNATPAELLVKAWEQDAAGINNTIDIYAAGKKPNYPRIDSISFNINTRSYKELVYDAVTVLAGDVKNDPIFFQLPLKAALLFLQLNERQDPAHFEPMETTVNKVAVKEITQTNWKRYPYSVLLVLGAGPEILTTPLSAEGMLRCRMAAQRYQEGLAPFVIVSGGNVHPFKTPFNEAAEMKAYMIRVLHVPETAVILEPHARHTTTNMRNAVRLMYRYHIPADKPALVVTDKSQRDAVVNMAGRCEKELKYVPYRLGKSVAETGVEFYPVKEAFQINPYEPLDP